MASPALGREARGHHRTRVGLEGQDFPAATDQKSTHGHRRKFVDRPVLSWERQSEVHRAVAVYPKTAVLGCIERPFGGNHARNVPGAHRCGAAGDCEVVFRPEVRRRARLGCFPHDPALRAAWVGLFELQTSSVARKRSAEVLETAGIVLQPPDHRTIRFRLLAPRHRVAQKESAKGRRRRSAQAPAPIEGDPAQAGSRLWRPGNVRRPR
jgi:hypothetical protein